MPLVEQDLSALGPGDHVCMAHVSTEEKHQAVATFFAAGLTRGERCVYATGEAHFDAVCARLMAAGLPVSQLRAGGAFVFMSSRDAYAPSGTFDPVDTAVRLAAMIDQTRADGFVGFRGTGEGEGAIGPEQREPLIRYEAAADRILRNSGARGLCLYDRRLTNASVMHAALCTHPLTLLGGRLCDNPFCDPSSYTLKEVGIERRVDSMIHAILRTYEGDRYNRAMNEALVREATGLATQVGTAQRHEAGLREALSMRDTLVGMLARQVQRPLAALARALESADRQTSDGLREPIESLLRLGHQIEQMAAFVDGTPDLGCEDVDLRELVGAVSDEVDATAAPGGTTFRGTSGLRHPVATLAPVMGHWNRASLTEIIRALLLVALDHGWGTPVDVAVDDLGPVARLTVRFRSPGMDPTRGSAGLGPGHGAAETDYDRMGLQLWTTRESVRRMGGTVGVCSWPDGRVSFTADLPRAAQTAAQTVVLH